MRLNALSRLIAAWTVVLVVSVSCNSDEVPRVVPTEHRSTPTSQPVEQKSDGSESSIARSEQASNVEAASDEETTQPQADPEADGAIEESQEPIQVDEPYVPVIYAHGKVSDAIVYTTSYSADSGSVWTRVSNRSVAAGAADGRLTLEVTCWQAGYLIIGLSGLPSQESRSGEVRLSIDGGAIVIEQWEYRDHFVGDMQSDTSAVTSRPLILYGQLVQASMLVIEVVGSGVAEATFRLEGMFETPVEGNLRHCGRYALDQTRPGSVEYIPLSGLQGTDESGIRWQVVSYNDGSIGSEVAIPAAATGADMGVLELVIGCSSDYGPSVRVEGLPGGDRDYLPAPVQLDQRPPESAWWHIYEAGLVVRAMRIDSVRLFYDLLEASAVMIDFSELGVGAATFNLAGAFATPIQGNLAHCGKYHPTEKSEREPTYVPVELVGGELGPATSYWAGRDENGRMESRVTLSSASAEGEAVPGDLILGCLDGWQVVVKLIRLPESDLQSLTVELMFDDEEPVSAVWGAELTRDGIEASYPRTALLMSMLHDAQRVAISIPELGFGPMQYDLAYLFKTPIQPNLDHCGQYSRS